jgi:hypothetical protein
VTTIPIRSYVIVRAKEAGVFAGTLEFRHKDEVLLSTVRRIWEWHGAASLSQLAQEGTSEPENCKLPCPVDHILLPGGVIEILAVTRAAQKCLESIPIWTA